jgi:RHS repeat-associated protein
MCATSICQRRWPKRRSCGAVHLRAERRFVRARNYDNDGNLVAQTDIATGSVTYYSYDYENRLTEIKQETSQGQVLNDEQFTYDVFGNQIGESLNGVAQRWTVFDGSNPYLDFNGSGQLQERYLGDPNGLSQFYGQVSASGTPEWYLTDLLGSVRQVVSPSGSVLDAITYDPYGNLYTQTDASYQPRFGYAGGSLDPLTGDYQFGARYYTSEDGRWESEDPLGLVPDRNPYRYVGNHPANVNDPTGLSPAPATKVPPPSTGSKSKYDLPPDWKAPSLYPVASKHVVVLGGWRPDDRRKLYTAMLSPKTSGLLLGISFATNPLGMILSKGSDLGLMDAYTPNDLVDTKGAQTDVKTLADTLCAKYSPGSIDLLTLSSHGNNKGGIHLSEGNDMTAQSDEASLRRIATLLAPNAVVIIDSCNAGVDEAGCQELANKLQAKVIATPDCCFLPSGLDFEHPNAPLVAKMQWRAFSPTTHDEAISKARKGE